ncbi:protein ALTERED PHOSPHATE STARVATION RESPONSE 1-like [Curcuma longa]|uniref:protein ALTERED PHOSPHATE STARVATION RESPONSE 1-like n=1 Tax=Curcuma longa TaxID=136217 RepID=UPI003D9DD272
MGGCAASRFGGGGDDGDPVALCRERKRLLKAAVERRYALAVAHAAYTHSLNAVAAAIDVFVSRHSAPAVILVALPDQPSRPSCSSSPPACLRHAPAEAKTESLECQRGARSPSLPDSSSGDEEAAVDTVTVEAEEDNTTESAMEYEYFFSAAPTMPPSPSSELFGWDFFNPFDAVPPAPEAMVLDRSSDEELRLLREEEGIPELEEEAEEEVECKRDIKNAKKAVALGEEKEHCEAKPVVEAGCGGLAEEKGSAVAVAVAVAEAQGSDRELLQALREVEDHFIRAYESGKEVSRMLEASMIHLHSKLDEMKENSSKMIHAITWQQSPSSMSSLSSSYRSHLASSSSSSQWSENKSDLFDDFSGMESGSHSQTLGRLYAWEKKLYEEVKAGDRTRQAYEKKCLQLRNQSAKGAGSHSLNKTRTAVRELHSQIWVALRAIESISERIQILRDEELQPQIFELLRGLMKSWKIMLESHETQKQIMFEVNSFTCPSYGKYCNDSQRLATLILGAELRNWRACFIRYISAQKVYVEALDGWLSKFILPDIEYQSWSSSAHSHTESGSTLVALVHEWSNSLGKLPEGPTSCSMRSFIRTVRFLWIKQGEEQQQKRKVDSLTKELERRMFAFQKMEIKILDSKLLEDDHSEPEISHRIEHLDDRKELLDMFKKKLEIEKAKHHACMRSTHEIILNGFKIGLASIFESLSEFANDSFKLYNELLMHNDKTKSVVIEGPEKPTFGKNSSLEEVNVAG